LEHQTPLSGLRPVAAGDPVLNTLKAIEHRLPRAQKSDRLRGLDFNRAGIAQAVGTTAGEAHSYAESRWGRTSKAAELISKASVAGLNTVGGSGAQAISAEGAVAEFFDMVRAQSLIGRLPLRRVPFRTRTLTMDEGPRVAWRDEGASYGNSPLKLTNQTGLEPYDLGALIVVTDEMLNDRSVDAELMIRDQLVKALAAALDDAFINPSNSGSAGVKPQSVTNAAGGMDSPSESLFDWGDTFQGDVSNAWILVNPWQAARLNSAARPDIGSRGGTWAGFPVLTSTAVPEGIFVLIDPARVAIATGAADIRISGEATVEMADSSSMTSATSVSGANQVSMWQTNSKAIIGSVSANWRIVTPDAVQVFDAQAYGLSGGM
jgi:hypothetical protein